jgi:hypothetical protein
LVGTLAASALIALGAAHSPAADVLLVGGPFLLGLGFVAGTIADLSARRAARFGRIAPRA